MGRNSFQLRLFEEELLRGWGGKAVDLEEEEEECEWGGIYRCSREWEGHIKPDISPIWSKIRWFTSGLRCKHIINLRR